MPLMPLDVEWGTSRNTLNVGGAHWVMGPVLSLRSDDTTVGGDDEPERGAIPSHYRLGVVEGHPVGVPRDFVENVKW